MEEQLIEFIAKSLVDHPEAVRLEESTDDRGTVLNLTVAQDDVGKVVGKHGRIVRAMRTLMAACSDRRRGRVSLSIRD